MPPDALGLRRTAGPEAERYTGTSGARQGGGSGFTLNRPTPLCWRDFLIALPPVRIKFFRADKRAKHAKTAVDGIDVRRQLDRQVVESALVQRGDGRDDARALVEQLLALAPERFHADVYEICRER